MRDHPEDIETELNFYTARKTEMKRKRDKNRWKKAFIEASRCRVKPTTTPICVGVDPLINQATLF
jgi:hypothetical protein